MDTNTSEILELFLTPHYGPDDDGDAGDRGDDFIPTGADAIDDDPKAEDDDVVDDDPKAEDDDDPKAEVDDEPKGEVDDEPKGEVEDDPKDDDPKGDEDPKGELDTLEKKKPAKGMKGRMDRALQRARQAEERNRVLEEQATAAQDADNATVDQLSTTIDELAEKIDDIDDQIEDARADGQTKTVKELRQQRRTLSKEMRGAERTLFSQSATEQAGASGDRAVEQIRYDSQLTAIETAVPELNPDNKAYNQDVVDDVLELKEAFEAKGYTSADALERAVGYIIPEAETDVDEVTKPEKRKTDVAKNLKDAGKQPADINKAGIDSDKSGAKSETPEASQLTEAEMDALPAETRKRMRGDFV